MMLKKRLMRRNSTVHQNFTSKPPQTNGKILQLQNLTVASTLIGKAPAETTRTVPIIDGRNRTGSIAVTYFIAGSLLIAALYVMAMHIYKALKQYLMSRRKSRRQSLTSSRKDSRKDSSAKLMNKEERAHSLMDT